MVTDSLYAPYEDEKYREFVKKLSLTDSLPRKGIRVPIIRELSKKVDWKDIDITWHEDVMLKGMAIGNSKMKPEEKIEALKSILPYLSSWDHTDTIESTFKLKEKNRDAYIPFFLSLLDDERTYPRRLGIVWIMSNRSKLDTREAVDLVIKADDGKDYYISMAVAWTMTSFVIDDPSLFPRLKELSPETEKRTMQKLRDSRRFEF